MPFSFTTCVVCNKSWSTLVLQGLFTYCLPNGTYLSIDRDFRWCNGCEGFSAVERLPDTKDAPWIKDRISPPRCLKCGSPDILEREPILHPNCGGPLRTEMCDAFVSTSSVYRRYDVEGRFLREYPWVVEKRGRLTPSVFSFFEKTLKNWFFKDKP